MISRNILIVVVLLLISLGGFIFWQRNNSSVSSQQRNTSQNHVVNSDQPSDPNNNTSQSFIDGLRNKEFNGGEITIDETVSSNNSYTSYIFSYPSDDLTIYGRMNVPNGNGPFPVIILNHGYYNPSSFNSGDGTQTMADILARNGYLTLASDYRGHGKSESDGERGGHRPEYSIDVLHLIASVKNLDKADENRIGMWGHSMGGEVTLRAIEATNTVKAVVLWAPTSGNAGDNHAFYGGNRARPTPNPDLAGISPINYLRYITAPISLHQGLEDVEVNPEWATELEVALKKQGKTVEYFEYEGQDHNFRNLGWDVISERTLAFYNKYLK